MSLLDTASLVITPNGTKASKLYSVVPSDGAGDMTVTRATTATRVNSAGLIASVASNVPRLDYSNGTCPSILVEPQRTNLLLRSQELSNASWVATNVTVTDNSTTSPDGTSNAEKITLNAGTLSKRLYQDAIQSGTYTLSVYLKAGTHNFVQLLVGNDPTPYANFNISNGTVSGSYGKIESVGNGWYRCSITYTSSIGTSIFIWAVDSLSSSRADSSSSTGDFYAWGTQLELGSYATSYIPTTSASVTRNADVISKTGISSLIGQTEGTLFVDFYHDGLANYNLSSISNGLYNDAVYFEMYLGNMYGVIWDSGSQQFLYNGGSLSVGRHKMAIGYKANDVVFYIDGVLKTTDTSATIPTTARVDVGSLANATIEKTQTNLTALWKTRLTNTQLASLTTI